jgi:hypothetical protein
VERTVKDQPNVIQISPAPNGWRVAHLNDGKNAPAEQFSTLDEAATALPAAANLHLSLPCHTVILERLRLPSINQEELAGMVRLQLEKNLPYSAEEVTSDFQIIEQDDKDSLVLAAAVHNEQLSALCQPLRDRAKLPVQVSLFALQVARICSPEATELLVYQESERSVAAICEKGKLTFAHAISSESLMDELPQLLLTAELDGVNTTIQRVRLEAGLQEMQQPLMELTGAPVEMFSLDAVVPADGGNLLPASWQEELRRISRKADLKKRLKLAAFLYAAVVILAFGYNFWLGKKVERLDQQLRTAQPQVEVILQRQARWRELSPAINPAYYTVELLYQVFKSMPSPDIRITTFDQTRDQFMIEGEAPSAALAIEFAEKLKQNTELGDFTFEATPPAILPNEHAQFRIFGKR